MIDAPHSIDADGVIATIARLVDDFETARRGCEEFVEWADRCTAVPPFRDQERV